MRDPSAEPRAGHTRGLGSIASPHAWGHVLSDKPVATRPPVEFDTDAKAKRTRLHGVAGRRAEAKSRGGGGAGDISPPSLGSLLGIR
jgi:hypothetical protein